MQHSSELPTAALIDGKEPALLIDGRESFCFAPPSANWLRKRCANGFHEPTLSILLLTLLRRAPRIFYDIGTLHGYFALLAAAGAGSVPVHAFEMNPESHATLLRNLRRNTSRGLDVSRIVAVHAVVSERDAGVQRMTYKGFRLQVTGEGAREADIPVISIDAYVERSGAPPGVMKIDVEGWEGYVIDGAINTLRRHAPTILMELHSPEHLGPHGRTRSGIVSLLLGLGYEAHLFRHNRANVTAPLIARPLSRKGVATLPDNFDARGDELVLFAAADPTTLWPGLVEILSH